MKHERKPSEAGTTRRELLTSAGFAVVGLSLGNSLGRGSVSQARTVSIQQLNVEEVRTFETLAEVLLPGARAAGIARYLNDQLGREMSLLFLRYMDYPGPEIDFYRQGLQSLERESHVRWDAAFAAGSEKQRFDLVQELMQKTPPGWNGPPAPLFCFVVRNDATDVFYGTPEGFAKLDIPYLPLIPPPAPW
jgi:Gluconate 2-dehydrogenase subunit 3